MTPLLSFDVVLTSRVLNRVRGGGGGGGFDVVLQLFLCFRWNSRSKWRLFSSRQFLLVVVVVSNVEEMRVRSIYMRAIFICQPA